MQVNFHLQAPADLHPRKQPPGTFRILSFGGPKVDVKVLERRSLVHRLVGSRNWEQVTCRLGNALTVRRILWNIADGIRTTIQRACRLSNMAFGRLYRKTPLLQHCRQADLAVAAVTQTSPIPPPSNTHKQDTRRKKVADLWLVCQRNST